MFGVRWGGGICPSEGECTCCGGGPRWGGTDVGGILRLGDIEGGQLMVCGGESDVGP